MTGNEIAAVRSTAIAILIGAALATASTAALAGPIVPVTWYEATLGPPTTGCQPADPAGGVCVPSSGTSTLFADAPPYTFNVDASLVGAVIMVVDAFDLGDVIDVFDFGELVGTTSVVAPGGNCGDDPEVCWHVASTGEFWLSAEPHSITFAPNAISAGDSGEFYFMMVLPEPTPSVLLVLGLGGLGVVARAPWTSSPPRD